MTKEHRLFLGAVLAASGVMALGSAGMNDSGFRGSPVIDGHCGVTTRAPAPSDLSPVTGRRDDALTALRAGATVVWLSQEAPKALASRLNAVMRSNELSRQAPVMIALWDHSRGQLPPTKYLLLVRLQDGSVISRACAWPSEDEIVHFAEGLDVGFEPGD